MRRELGGCCSQVAFNSKLKENDCNLVYDDEFAQARGAHSIDNMLRWRCYNVFFMLLYIFIDI